MMRPWLAGFFDGEGSVGLYKMSGCHRGYEMRAQITQLCSPIVDRLFNQIHLEYGGNLYLRGDTPSTRRWRPTWHYTVTSMRAHFFLQTIRPWLLLKATQADHAMHAVILQQEGGHEAEIEAIALCLRAMKRS